MIAFRYCFLGTLISVTAPSWADPSLECSASASSQVEIGNCVSRQLEQVNKALAIALDIASGSAKELDEVTGREIAYPALTKSQDAWEAHRKAHCDFVGSTFGGGSGAGIAIASCQIELGRDRVKALLRNSN
ncbi:DUF1311 domain-containing protein [Halocynthiibacter sp. C4]|uniref:lysozyme inhibitor LprI family protein n=1 Tax=Halocynthiibacter sp. C4 TaxID=2992758 RepID=UPI00237A33B4|nr:lysozyme inhibitor LprI family protein [Halocynthiibacter sp. C4]MDE0588349.1 DUF1311 domain-containing protein [Halocynthiibacter sp. C4]